MTRHTSYGFYVHNVTAALTSKVIAGKARRVQSLREEDFDAEPSETT
jgi:hypothetical protein